MDCLFIGTTRSTDGLPGVFIGMTRSTTDGLRVYRMTRSTTDGLSVYRHD